MWYKYNERRVLKSRAHLQWPAPQSLYNHTGTIVNSTKTFHFHLDRMKCIIFPQRKCYFSVVADPLIAKLEGGSFRVVDNSVQLQVNATESFDPNEPKGVEDHLVYDWSCTPEDATLCLGVPKIKADKLVLEPIPGKYTFTVTVSVNKAKAPNIGTFPEEILPASAVATQTVTILKELVTELEIRYGGNKGKAEFLVTARRTLESVLGDGNCKFLPQSGISGFDLFNLTCEYPNTIYGFPLRFELFQVPNISNPDSEILIAFSDENKILGLLLAAGEKSQGYQTHIYLRIEDHFAESMKIKVATVTVKPITETPGSKNITDTIQKLISGTSGTPSMESYVSLGDISGAVGLISLLTVALATSDLKPEEVWKFKKQFISSLDQIPLNNDAPIRQVVSVLHLVLGAGEREDEIPPECVREISNIILKLTTEMTLQINESYIEYEVSTQELKTIYHMMLEMLSCLLYSMNETIAKITIPPAFEVTTLPGEEIPDYAEYYELNPNYFKCKALLHRLAEEQLPISITTKYLTMWVKVAFTGKNPFIWDKESKDINTGLVIVDIYNQELNESVSIPSDADIFLKEFQNLSSTIIEGNVTVPLKSKDDIDILEECMTVHKIEAKEGQTPFLKFEPLEDQSFKIQIVVTVGVRPTAEMFTKYSESVPHSVQPGSLDDQLTVFVDGVNLLKRSWFFLAVLPHPDTLEPGLETGPEQLHCRCSHLSTFSGSLLAPDIKGDFFTAIPMLILGSDNIVIPIFVAIILSLKAAPRKIQHNPQAEAILVEIPRKRHKPTWWQRVLMFFMLEPLVHPARTRTELMAEESNSSDELSKEESPTELIQEFRGSKYWLPFWVTFIGWYVH
ncbi:hypothetical protein C0J52_15879 [Blattella germanica]|nr:hypothetical protein C0J52_15879 [Blattella germanica]